VNFVLKHEQGNLTRGQGVLDALSIVKLQFIGIRVEHLHVIVTLIYEENVFNVQYTFVS